MPTSLKPCCSPCSSAPTPLHSETQSTQSPSSVLGGVLVLGGTATSATSSRAAAAAPAASHGALSCDHCEHTSADELIPSLVAVLERAAPSAAEMVRLRALQAWCDQSEEGAVQGGGGRVAAGACKAAGWRFADGEDHW